MNGHQYENRDQCQAWTLDIEESYNVGSPTVIVGADMAHNWQGQNWILTKNVIGGFDASHDGQEYVLTSRDPHLVSNSLASSFIKEGSHNTFVAMLCSFMKGSVPVL